MKLNQREKYAIYAASGIVCLFVLIHFIVSPLVEKKQRMEKNLTAKTRILQDMLTLKAKYEVIQKKTAAQKANLAKRKHGFTLFSYLDTLAGRAGIKTHIIYMKPSASASKNGQHKIASVEMKAQALTLKQLASYLHLVETSENQVFIKRLSVSKTSKPEGFVDAVLQVETFEM